MSSQERSEQARTIRANAAAFLDDLGIPALLRRFGELHYSGSYALDLMTWNDLDLQLVLWEGQEPVAALGAILLSLAGAEGFREARLTRFEGSYKPHMPRGVFLGLRFDSPECGGPWKVDLWTLEPADFARNQALLMDLRARLNPELRELILEFKHALMAGKDRIPAMASHRLYQLVLLDGLRTWRELQEALGSEGFSLVQRRPAEVLPPMSFLRWRDDQEALGRRLVDEALRETSARHDVLLVVNPVNPAALAQFLRSEVQSKGHGIPGRTLRSGLQAGFLPPDASHRRKPLTFAIDGIDWVAVVRDGEERLVAEPRPGDQVLEVRCLEDGTCLTADLDLVLIAGRNAGGGMLRDPEYGDLAMLEKPIILDLNQRFQSLVERQRPGQGRSRFKLVAHGPLNRFSNPCAVHLRAPLEAYAPWGEHRILVGTSRDIFAELRGFLEGAARQGYTCHLDPDWSV